jgi:hypothetical protein
MIELKEITSERKSTERILREFIFFSLSWGRGREREKVAEIEFKGGEIERICEYF